MAKLVFSPEVTENASLRELERSSPGDLYERVILGTTRENKAGLAFFPSDEDQLAFITAFLEIARQGDKRSAKIIEDLRQGKVRLSSDNPDIEVARLVGKALKNAHLKREQLALVSVGFTGLLANDQETDDTSKEAAKKFTEGLYSAVAPNYY